MPFPITPYDHIALCTELSALLAAAPAELRTVNLSDRWTFTPGVDQGLPFDDGLDDCAQVYGDGADDIDLSEDFGP